MFDVMDQNTQSAVIKVIGVGGGGENAVSYMMNENNIQGVNLFECQYRRSSTSGHNDCYDYSTWQFHYQRFRCGGANLRVGKRAAEESREKIQEILKGTDLFIWWLLEWVAARVQVQRR